MFRFSIRDVLWLTVVVGMGVGWWMHVRQLDARYSAELNKAFDKRFVETERLLQEVDKIRAIKAAEK